MSNQSVWDKHYGRTRARQQYPDENVVRVLKKLYTDSGKDDLLSAGNPVPPCTRALDLGTGSGRHLSLMAEHFQQLYAADFSHASLQLLPAGVSLTAQLALPEIPFASGTFDFILCWGVLHYLQPAAVSEAVSEILRILKPGGRVFLTLRSDTDTHLRGQLASGDLASGHAELFSKNAAIALFQHFSKTAYGYIARQPLGEEGIVAHHMILAEK